MNREIKFRAWYKLKRVMIVPNITDWCIGFDGMVYDHNTDGHTCSMTTDGENFELMQFAGLKDKNEDDLDFWESDIIEETDAKETVRGVIKFEDGCFIVDYGKHGKYLLKDRLYYNPKKIGNIYDNPELLREK